MSEREKKYTTDPVCSGPPIYTVKTECQDCYKCIRECPVKAIKVEGASASVMPELCVLCGHCVNACPHGAKQVRDDLPRAKDLISERQKVVASLDPSFISEFDGVSPGGFIRGLKMLGFWGVSEAALGAELVSSQAFRLLDESEKSVFISSSCPTVVQYLRRYQPDYAKHIMHFMSPVLAHARLLRQHYGEKVGVIFIGPCIARKKDADDHPELIDVTITFEDIRRWFDDAGIDVSSLAETKGDVFIPRHSNEGALYSVVGGMIESIRGQKKKALHAQFIAFSGIRRLKNALRGFEEVLPDGNLLLELSACFGGCVNGPKSLTRAATVAKRYRVIRYARPAAPRNTESTDIHLEYPPDPVRQADYTEEMVRDVLRQVGKYSEKDELNCSGCGYDSCRDFAEASLSGKAERSMCAGYMRQLAQKKADILIRKMPSAAVIVDNELRIVECNPNFSSIFRKDDPDTDEPMQLEGMLLTEVVPFHEIFRQVLKSGEDVAEKNLRFHGRILHGTIFTIEKNSLIGALFEDITMPAMKREEIIKRARHVIQQNLQTVQKIAYLMGENAAESEIILNSIVDSFTVKEMEDEDD
ncbi:MAG TPA: [Fe-Fe] hydrogenase large subunit C-terminal domain-containing protein [Dissulfurispiraceae bacterium]|nr:[Fe-Fe] hydrogenase large subunit C-terminal domain-containing protein [Dissulfurispiraceae bacterium]